MLPVGSSGSADVLTLTSLVSLGFQHPPYYLRTPETADAGPWHSIFIFTAQPAWIWLRGTSGRIPVLSKLSNESS